uniref:Ras association domain-containing protein n=1 Tax=Electrophorus electricus TaxID=8005 RepID=A0AAY5EF78_ELEEL
MEVKVYVEGIQRIVCGVTDKTTCEEIVIALAQATGRTGRYTLREKVKEYERNVTPGERLLESLTKYGQQAREVQLTLQHLGPSLGEGTNEPLAPLRRGAGLHRQSLPLLSCLRLHPEPLPEELKKPKRKSLTLMEEAWGWLENLGRVGRQISRLGKCGKETLEYEVVGRNVGAEQSDGSFEAVRGEEAELRRIIIQQQACLRELELKIDSSDEQSRLLELQQAERWSAERIPLLSEEEEEQLEFWLNELKAEGDYEKDLQTEFLQLKEKVAECKNKLEEYKAKLLHADGTSSSVQTVQSEEVESTSGSAMEEKTVADSPGGGSKERAAITTVDSKLPCVLESANQIESQPSGPSELREWWSRWAQAQKPTQGSTPKTVHRSELTIHLGSTRV